MSRRSSSIKHDAVYDVTHSRRTKMSCFSRLMTSVAWEILTTSGGLLVDCGIVVCGVSRSEAHW